MSNIASAGLTPLTWCYVAGVAAGYYGLPLLLVGTILYPLLLLVRRAAVFICVTVLSIIIYFFLIDSLVFRIFKFHLSHFWIEWVLLDFDSLGLTSSTLSSAIGMLGVVIAVEIGILRFSVRLRSLQKAARLFPALALLAFGACQTIHIIAYRWNDDRITKLSPILPLYIPIHSHSNAPKLRALFPWIGTEEEKSPVGQHSTSLRYPLRTLQFTETCGTTTPNIIIIMLESWRYDAMTVSICPNICTFGEQSSVFLNHLSSGNQTTCGVFGLFYGLHATYWPAVKANAKAIDNPVLIDVLTSRGYDFVIFARSNFERHKIKDTIFNGFEIHENFAGRTIPEQDADMTAKLLDFIETHERSGNHYLAFAFYKSSHAPYACPRAFTAYEETGSDNWAFTTGGTDPASRLAKYHASIRYEDVLVGLTINRLESLGVLDKTVVIVTTDHGESFNDNSANYWGHGSCYTQYQIRVPLIFYAPGRESRRVTRRTSHVDIAPTILEEYFGCVSEAREYSNGRNLFEDKNDLRPLVVGSYFNHAFVFGDDVYEILSVYTKKYRLDDVNCRASPPNPDLLKKVAEEIGRFAASEHTTSDFD